MIGVAIRGNKASEALAMIEQAEQLGLHAACSVSSWGPPSCQPSRAIPW